MWAFVVDSVCQRHTPHAILKPRFVLLISAYVHSEPFLVLPTPMQARIHAGDGMVRFLEAPEAYSGAAMAANIDGHIKRCAAPLRRCAARRSVITV